jgi:hypothetical protein
MRSARRVSEQSGANNIEIKAKIEVKQFRNWKFDGRPRLRFLSWDYDEPAVALAEKVTAELKRSEVFASDWDKGEECNDQAISAVA